MTLHLPPSSRRPNRIQSVQRALAVLKAFDDSAPELGVSELARRLGLSKSIVMRLVSTLRDEGFLEQSPRSTKYRLGLAAFEVGNLYYLSASLKREAEPLLEGLAQRLGFSTYLGTLSGDRAVYISVIEGPGPIRIGPRIGSSAPAHTTAAGKAMLAALNDTALEHYLGTADLHPETPASIMSKQRLRSELAQVRAQGFAVSRGEHLNGVGSIGVAIIDRHGAAIASVSVGFPLFLVPEAQWPPIVSAVLDVAQQISRRLGTQGSNTRETAQIVQ
jgi:IclR family transcriptional regulator, KDG regulon repressor